MNKYKDFLLELFFPSFCLGCQKEGTYLCQDCKATLDISEFNYCLCNKNPLRLSPEQKKRGKCNKCSNKNLSGLYSALPYKENHLTKKLIHQFKYQPYIKDLAKTLAGLLIDHFILSDCFPVDLQPSPKIDDRRFLDFTNFILIPVPLDKNKLKSRGYNQAEELSKELSKILQVPVITNVLLKTKSTKQQMELSKAERETNLQGAFSISNRHCEKDSSPTKQSFDLSGKKLFLVDDVYTTGSTMEECARTLKQAGAKSVWGIAIAREE